MTVNEIIQHLEQIAPPSLQETYDNCGLITGSAQWECTGIMLCLDSTEAVINEARDNGCNLVIAHHPIIFGGLKKISGSGYVEKTVVAAIKNDIAIYAIHTNLDNVLQGVSGKMAAMLGLENPAVLSPKSKLLKKLSVFVPDADAEKLRDALFTAGAGHIGKYSECSFSSKGAGTFLAGEGASPFVGQQGIRHTESESKLELVFPAWCERQVLRAMHLAHPYEEVAYDIFSLDNMAQFAGSGVIAELPETMEEKAFLQLLKRVFGLTVVRHTPLTGRPVKKIAVCGGAGSFLLKAAIAAKADFYVTADLKYHEFFDAEEKLVVADIGHYESEQFTIDLVFDILQKKNPTFAVLKTEIKTNPVHYFV